MCSDILFIPFSLTFTIIGVGILSIIIYTSWSFSLGTMPKLYYKESALAKYVVRKCTRLRIPFCPPFWARNRHVQTILGTLYHKTSDFRFEREYLLMKDRGVIAVDWGVIEPNMKVAIRNSSPILICLPTLTGNAMGMSYLCKLAVSRGYRPVVFNKRGHGDSPLTSPKLQSFGDPLDLRQVIKYIKAKFADAKLTAVGTSAGSGLLASYLGEYGSSCHLTAAVCICPGYDSERLLARYIKQPYDFLMLYNLKRILSRHALALSRVIDVDYAMQSTSLAEFEERVYCRMYGYESMAHYWDKNNPNREIDEIQIPVMCINCCDDPVCVKENIPYELFFDLPNFMLVTTELGGHCGLLEAPNLEPWGDKLSLDYLDAVLKFCDSQKNNVFPCVK